MITDSARFNFCPKSSCDGEIVEVDELFVLPIKILNQKNYSTQYCCSGHFYEAVPDIYIMFDSYVELPDIPNGFVLEGNPLDKGYTIRKSFNEELNEIDLQKEITLTAFDVLKWAEKLEKYDF